MLTIVVPETELFDNTTQKFVTAPTITLSLEHSLIAISKWESKYKVPFFKNLEYLSQHRHFDKFLYYINCMSTKGEIQKSVLERLTIDNIKEITEYISDTHSASISNSGGGGNSRTPITSERIYALMACYQVPPEYAKWHINNLLIVINMCSEMHEDPKKRKRSNPSATVDFYEQNEKLRKQGIAL